MDALPGLLALSRWLDEKGQAVKQNVRNPAGLFAAFEQEVQQGAAKDKSAWDASRSVMPEVRAQGINEINARGQELGGLLGTFAGVGAKTADAVKLGKAKDMMKAGADPVQVWQQTGWTNQFPDGKWRFEISDKPAKVKPNPADYGQDRLISESVTHPDYFAAYPQLRDMTGTFDRQVKDLQGVGSAGFLEDYPHISVTASAKETKPITMHELQHVVQGEEGFARGGSIEEMARTGLSPQEKVKEVLLRNKMARAEVADRNAINDELHKLILPGARYRRLAGEAEARLTQKRMDLTPEERLARPPWLEFDVPPEQQLVRGLLGEQTGPAMWTAYHGSPHTFDKFDMSRMGTGEGAQAFGKGLYFADSPQVAKEYQPNSWKRSYTYQGRSGNDWQSLFENAQDYDKAKIWESIQLHVPKNKLLQELKDEGYSQDAIKYASSLPKRLFAPPGGNIYKVDISDAKAPKESFMQWDKPMAEQPQAVQNLISEFAPGMKVDPRTWTTRWVDEPKTGADLYQSLINAFGDNKAAAILAGKGVPGIRYFDAASREAGHGTMNTVLFDDSLVKILERNGVPISGLLAP